jgi:oligosaccharide repeat unit polymerase
MQSLLILLSLIYVFFALLSVYYSLASFTYTFQDADFAEIYEEDVEQYANVIDGIAKRYTEYFRPVMFLSVFYFLFKKRSYELFFSIVFIISVFCSLMICALNASRGGAFNLVMMVLVCMVMFWRYVRKKERKRLIFIGILITLIFIGYSYLVTISRFVDDSTNSVLFYFGHSFLAFNYGIAGRVPSLSYGTYVFDWFLPFWGIDPIPSPTPKVAMLFYTFIGSLYKDFGLVGTFIVAIVFPFLISLLIRPHKGRVDFASLYLYLFYMWRLMSGVFVYGKAEGFLWFVALLIFLFLRFLSNSSIKKQTN